MVEPGAYSGVGFAVPVNVAREIPQLRDKGHVVRGWLGVQVQSIEEDLAKTTASSAWLCVPSPPIWPSR